jgi:hypothetical protein
MMDTTDSEIRSALKLSLQSGIDASSGAKLVDELTLPSKVARIDIALLDGILHGYEIKSDRDTLSRLSHQAAVYNALFDRMTVVVGLTHAAAALRMVPVWWSVHLAQKESSGAISFSVLREGLSNPTPDVHVLVRMLWKREALELLQQLRKGAVNRNDTKASLCNQLVHCPCSPSVLRNAVCEKLMLREDWKFAASSESDGDSALRRSIS